MAFTGWFPHFSPSGANLVCGTAELWINRTQNMGFGYLGCPSATRAWINETTVVYSSTETPELDRGYGLYSCRVGGTRQPLGVSGNFYELAVGLGRWAGWDGSIRTSWGETITADGPRAPAVSSTHFAYLLDGYSDRQRLILDGATIDRAPITSPRMSEQALCYVRWTDTGMEVWGLRIDAPDVPRRLSVSDAIEYEAIPIDRGGDVWVLSYDATRLILRPFGENDGYIVATGETMYPHGVYQTSSGQFRIAWSSSTGVYAERFIDPDTEPTVVLGDAETIILPGEAQAGFPGASGRSQYPPFQHPITDSATGLVSRPWAAWFEAASLAQTSNTYGYVGSNRVIGRGQEGSGPATPLRVGVGLQIRNGELFVSMADLIAGFIQYGPRFAQPSADTVMVGTIYGVSDEQVIERSNGTVWEPFGPV